jgi:hypothetical protein
MPAAEVTALYNTLVNAKSIAPTHSHPSAPDKPLISKVDRSLARDLGSACGIRLMLYRLQIMHPIAGALDRARDMLMGPVRQPAGEAASLR